MRLLIGAVAIGLFAVEVGAQVSVAITENYSPSAILRGGIIYYTIANWRDGGNSMSVGTFTGSGTDTLPSIKFESDWPITMTAEDPANPEVSLLHAFTLNAAGNLMHARYMPGAWREWHSHGGVFTSRPTAAWYAGKLYVFGRGSDGAIWYTSGSGDTFARFQGIAGSGSLESAPGVATGPDGIHMVGRRGTEIFHATFNGTALLATWKSLGCCAAGDPAIAFVGGDLFEVSMRGTDSHVWRQTYTATRASGWAKVDGSTAASPAVVAAAAGNATMVVYGLNKQSYYASRTAMGPYDPYIQAVATFSLKTAQGSTSGYGSPSFKNYAPFPVRVKVNYSACSSVSILVNAATDDGLGKTVPGTGTGGGGNLCLLTSVTGDREGGLAPAGAISFDIYQSSGTSYRKFIIAPYSPGNPDLSGEWRIFSSHEWSDPDQGTGGSSPGFSITNKTLYPVVVTLDQAGCLYYDALNPGESMNRITGAVWFTISTHIEPRGKGALNSLSQDLICAEPIVSITTSVLMGFATGAAAQWAGMTAAQNIALVGRTFARLLPGTAIRSGAGEIAQQLASTATSQLLQALTDNQSTRLYGQYAGPPWPFRCSQKPQYDITGGWGPTQVDADGNRNIDKGAKLVLTKTNDCGNSMMAK